MLDNKLIAVVSILLVLTGSGWALDTSKNPDKYPSIGLNLDSDTWSGGYNLTYAADSLKMGEYTNGIRTLEASLRMPVSNRLTLEGSYRGVRYKQTFSTSDNNYMLDSNYKANGHGFGVGVRYYFVK